MNNVPSCLVLICTVTLFACTSPRIAQSNWSAPPPGATDAANEVAEAAPPRLELPPPQQEPAPRQQPQEPAPRQQPRAPQSSPQKARDDRRDVPWEVTLSGGGTNDEHFNRGNGSVDASVGYYFTEVLELVGRQSVFHSEDELPAPDDELWAFKSTVGVDLHFPLGQVVPYVGGFVGWLYGDIPPDETMTAGPEAGVKIYLQRAAFLHLGAEWAFFFDEQDTIDDAFEEGQIFYTAGFGLRF